MTYATPLTLDFSFFHSSSHLAARTGMEKGWLGAGSTTHCLAGASLGSATPCTVLTHCSVSPFAVTIPLKWNLLFYSFGKYLSEQMMLLSCQNIFFLILTEGIIWYCPSSRSADLRRGHGMTALAAALGGDGAHHPSQPLPGR